MENGGEKELKKKKKEERRVARNCRFHSDLYGEPGVRNENTVRNQSWKFVGANSVGRQVSLWQDAQSICFKNVTYLLLIVHDRM